MIRDWADRRAIGEGPFPFTLPLAALVLFALCAWLAWPGIAAFDTIRQYGQALARHYDDWHPPAMAWLWVRFLALGIKGTAPMLLLQLGLYWLGIGLLASALARAGARGAAWLALLAGLSPLVADWMVVVVKDAQMLAAMVAATGIVARYWLAGRAMPWPAVVLVALLLGYALLARANAVFAVAPLAWAWTGWAGIRSRIARALVLIVSMALALVTADMIDHRMIGADRSHVERVLPLFDLAGIAHWAHLPAAPGVDPDDWAAAERQGCYTPFYWDPFGDPRRCGEQGDALVDDDGGRSVERVWIATILAHPIAYAQHRLAHLNATLRIATPADEASTAAPPGSDANPYRLGARPSARTQWLRTVAVGVARSPFGSPAVWLVIMLAAAWVMNGCPDQPARALGLALALSAALMTASFAVVSIASDLRYHLWLIAAGGLVVVLLAACRAMPRRRSALALVAVALAFAVSAMLRAHALPLPI